MSKETKKRSFVFRLHKTPVYWKIVITIVMFFGGGSGAAQLFTGGSDMELFAGIVIFVFLIWFFIQLWWPVKNKK